MSAQCPGNTKLPYIARNPADRRLTLNEMSMDEYDKAWAQWDDMKIFGPFSRHLRRLIINLIRPLEFETVLDVSCGQGSFLAELGSEFPHLKPHGTEISSVALAQARTRVPHGHFWFLDLAKAHLDQRFDLVVCSEVLEHIADDVAAIENLVCMTGRYLVVSTPQGRMRGFEVSVGHVRNYASGELVRKLELAGLRILRVIEWGFPFYSPLYRDVLNRTGGRGTSGKYGPLRRLIAQAIYAVFAWNSSQRGDAIIVLAEPLARS